MRFKKSDKIRHADDTVDNAGIRKQGERLRRRYWFNPVLNSRASVGNLKPRFSDINRRLPLLEHLQRYLPGGSSHERFSALPHLRNVSRKEDRLSGPAADNWPQSPNAVGHLPPLTKTATAGIDRQSRDRLAVNSSTGDELRHYAEAPETAGHGTLLSAHGDRLSARYLRMPLTHKSKTIRFQRQSAICTKFIPRHLSALIRHARSKATQFAMGQQLDAPTSTGKAVSAPGIKTEMEKGVKGAAPHRISTAAKPRAKRKADGVVRSSDASRQPSHWMRQSTATSREDDKGIHPKALSGDGSKSNLQMAAAVGKVPAPGGLDEFCARPQNTHRRLQTKHRDTGMDSDAPNSVGLKLVSAKYPLSSLTMDSTADKYKSPVNRADMHNAEQWPHGRGAVDISTGIADQTAVSIKRQKSSISTIEDKSGILSSLPHVYPKRFNSNTADTISTALKSRHAFDRRRAMIISISNVNEPTGSLLSSGVESAAPKMFSSQDLPVVKPSPHGIAAKPNASAVPKVSAPRHLQLRHNESHPDGGMPLTLARSTRVDQSPSMTGHTESFDPASIASERTTPLRDDTEPDVAQAQEIKTDELVERVMRKVLRTFSIERERRGWFPWN